MPMQKKYDEIVAKAWADPEFKDRLIQEPHAVLLEHGIEVQEGSEIKVMEDSETVQHIILPRNSSDGLVFPFTTKLCQG